MNLDPNILVPVLILASMVGLNGSFFMSPWIPCSVPSRTPAYYYSVSLASMVFGHLLTTLLSLPWYLKLLCVGYSMYFYRFRNHLTWIFVVVNAVSLCCLEARTYPWSEDYWTENLSPRIGLNYLGFPINLHETVWSFPILELRPVYKNGGTGW